MGNSLDCCGQKSPCENTEDEVRGLLHSSDSKTSTKAGTENCTSPTSDAEDRNEEPQARNTEDDIEVISEQPTAEQQSPKAQSSYSAIISLLHTGAVAEVNHPCENEATITETTGFLPEIQDHADNISGEPADLAQAAVETVSSVKEEKESHGEQLGKLDITSASTEDAAASVTSPVVIAPVEETPVAAAVAESPAEKKAEVEPETHVETEDPKEAEDPVPEDRSCGKQEAEGSAELTDNSRTGHTGVSDPSVEMNVLEKSLAINEAIEDSELPSEVEEHEKEPSETSLEHSEPHITNGFPPLAENGVEDSKNMNAENDVKVPVALPINNDADQKIRENATENEEPPPEPPPHSHSTTGEEYLAKITQQEKSEDAVNPEQETLAPAENGLNSTSASVPTSPVEESGACNSGIKDTDPEKETSYEHELLKEVLPDNTNIEPQQTEDEKAQEVEACIVTEETMNTTSQEEGIIFRNEKLELKLIPPSETTGIMEDESAELYLGAEEMEISSDKDKPLKPLLELRIPGVETRCSLAPAVDILAYSEQEWKGNTAKSILIRKGYGEVSRSFSALRRVRGDNYCALRATLYQLLLTTTGVPTWVLDESFLLLPEMIEAGEHLTGGWRFPQECTWGCEELDSVERLKYYLLMFRQKWQETAACESLEEKQHVCECVFQSGEEEFGLLESLKFLMLAKAVELHRNMVADQEVPVFCWLLFARDTSENPQTLLANHLSQIGFSGGVEQVEMFLLGYALQHTIQAFRLYMTDTEEFVTHYPDDHKQDWPCVCIVTEDDRHYNVPVWRTVQHQQSQEPGLA